MNQYFYHQLTRKFVILFGNMFNNITIKRVNTDDDSEIERFKIPIIYSPKEKYYARLQSDPDLQRELQISVPRMSFDMVSITYDPSRKQNTLLRNVQSPTSTTVNSQYMSVPYDLGFELNIYARNIDDGTHIVEQILPYFTPDYTIPVTAIADMGIVKDIPLVLNSVTNSIEHEGNFESVRVVNWTLRFTMKVDYYGPISQSKLITKANTNFVIDYSLQNGYPLSMNVANGNNGSFHFGDYVFQGTDYSTATAFGTVDSFSANTGILRLYNTQGRFIANNEIRSTTTNAAYTISSFQVPKVNIATISVTPSPNTALPNSDYGYSITVNEYPYT